MNSEILRKIPKVDEIISSPMLKEHKQGLFLTDAVRIVLEEIREKIRAGCIKDVPIMTKIILMVIEEIDKKKCPNLSKVINGTGIIIHTNLGRAPLAEEAIKAIDQAARGYSNLEYNILEGKRGSRHSHINELITKLTTAEAAIAVNNNAAAVLLSLCALSFCGSEIIVSRGEIVEIGGSFRIPDVCALSGSKLIEVGTTNKTHIQDYENAINTQTAAILSVHPSNFSITGFVSKPEVKELAKLAKSKNIPLIEDLGSGCLLRNSKINERTITDSINSGVDVVTSSGDKLLGGPQAGIIAGKKSLIEKIKKHPLARVVRIDKLSLAALEATLRLYLDPQLAKERIPIQKMLNIGEEELEQRANELKNLMGENINVVKEKSQAGGGTLPGVEFTSYAVEVFCEQFTAIKIENQFRNSPIPIIGRIKNNKFTLDVRTIEPDDYVYIANRWLEIKKNKQVVL